MTDAVAGPDPGHAKQGPVDCAQYPPKHGGFDFHWCVGLEHPGALPPCPDDRACLFRRSSTALGRRDWDHVWNISIAPNARQARSIAALRTLLELEGVERIAASCAVVRHAPILFGEDDEWIEVPIATDPSAKPPRSVTPDEADRLTSKARGRETEPIFTREEKAKMVGATFDEPTIRVHEEGRPDLGGDCGDLGCTRMFVLYSPESAKVFLLERSFTGWDRYATGTEYSEVVIDVERAQPPSLGAWLRSMPITSVRFPIANACDIPDDLGGRRWYDLDLGATR